MYVPLEMNLEKLQFMSGGGRWMDVCINEKKNEWMTRRSSRGQATHLYVCLWSSGQPTPPTTISHSAPNSASGDFSLALAFSHPISHNQPSVHQGPTSGEGS